MMVHCIFRSFKVAVLLLSIQPLLDQCLLHLHPTHRADLPTYLPLPQLIKGVVRGQCLCWFPWQPMNQPDVNSPSSDLGREDWHHVLPASNSTWWGVAPGPFQTCKLPPSIKPLIPLLLTLDFFFDLEAGWAQAFVGLWGVAQHWSKSRLSLGGNPIGNLQEVARIRLRDVPQEGQGIQSIYQSTLAVIS